jgi:hypothetical protein
MTIWDVVPDDGVQSVHDANNRNGSEAMLVGSVHDVTMGDRLCGDQVGYGRRMHTRPGRPGTSTTASRARP